MRQKPSQKQTGSSKRRANPLPNSLPYTIDYKNVALLRRYIGITGKILPRRVNGLTAKQHRAVARAIRQARVAGRLPFVWITDSLERSLLRSRRREEHHTL